MRGIELLLALQAYPRTMLCSDGRLTGDNKNQKLVGYTARLRLKVGRLAI
jgi:hypothetical protein